MKNLKTVFKFFDLHKIRFLQGFVVGSLTMMMFSYQNCGPANMQYAFEKSQNSFTLNADRALFVQSISRYPLANLRPGDKFRLELVFENNGTGPWMMSENVFLQINGAALWQVPDKSNLTSDVGVNGRTTFVFEITAPAVTSGCQKFLMEARMTRQGVGGFGQVADIGNLFSICVAGSTPTPTPAPTATPVPTPAPTAPPPTPPTPQPPSPPTPPPEDCICGICGRASSCPAGWTQSTSVVGPMSSSSCNTDGSNCCSYDPPGAPAQVETYCRKICCFGMLCPNYCWPQ